MNSNKVVVDFLVYISTFVARFYWISPINLLITSELFFVVALNNSNVFFLVLQKKKKKKLIEIVQREWLFTIV